MKTRSFKVWRVLVALVLVAVIAVAAAQLALADTGRAQGHAFDVTFTKWITGATSMVGVGGGAIGPATFKGEILDLQAANGIENVVADYHFNGSKHSFSARIHARQDDAAGTGVITGEITEGWLKGGSLTGEYKVLPQCNMDTPGNVMDPPTLCFQGVLHLRRAP